eukprot:CAMPEP_0175186712 /NCGR_PEP_ID=MMETSP0093-20121207/2533_1 /TAXON_ID=311494 /ORGANISM="Alexandrium monilatum, Strain CCMP3105" /LENGTH=289 /DNA_ID=CAMNT_0016479443 /DNA_START=212 /DNA_END=1079 /DNA_ORIENTATION=+
MATRCPCGSGPTHTSRRSRKAGAHEVAPQRVARRTPDGHHLSGLTVDAGHYVVLRHDRNSEHVVTEVGVTFLPVDFPVQVLSLDEVLRRHEARRHEGHSGQLQAFDEGLEGDNLGETATQGVPRDVVLSLRLLLHRGDDMREEVDVVCVVEFAEDLRQPADGPRHWCEHVRAQHVEGLHDRCRHPDDHIVERVESCRRATHHEDGSLVARASELEEGCPVVALRVGVHALRVDQLPTWVEELCGIPDGRLRLIGNGGEEAKVAEANLPMSGPEVEPGRASQACGIPLLH